MMASVTTPQSSSRDRVARRRLAALAVHQPVERFHVGALAPFRKERGRAHRRQRREPLARRGLQGYIFQTGQPAKVRAAFLAAMGFSEAEAAADPRPFDPLASVAR